MGLWKVLAKRKTKTKPGEMDWKTLESVLRYYQEFLELYRRDGIEEITLDGNIVINIHDILQGIDKLPKRQQQAVRLTCLMNMREVDAARLMGFEKWSSPVSSYKSVLTVEYR
jgi:hypothetical protein